MKIIFQLAPTLIAVASVVAACGGNDDSNSAVPHPELSCGGEGSGTGNYDLAGPGFEFAAGALDDRLSYYQDLYGGQIIELPDNEGALRVEGANVVVAIATESADGGWLVQEDYFCNSYQPQP